MSLLTLFFFFFFNDTATTEIYTLSLHDALPISGADPNVADRAGNAPLHTAAQAGDLELVKKLLAKGTNPNVRTADRKSTRLNSSHGYISYAVFCLKKKKNKNQKYR